MRIAAVAVLLLALVPAAADARAGSCLPGGDGPRCTFRKARVIHVHDGDTIEVRSRGRAFLVRLTGINAMEMTVYSGTRSRRRGECHAIAATNRLEDLVRASRRRVRLAAQDRSSRSGRRLRRTVAVRRGGVWRDAGEILLREGHALWLNNSVEWAWNRTYGDAVERAAARGRNLWDPDACGAGPSAGTDIAVEVNWDADGADGANINGEWIRVENRGERDLPLSGWWVRDSALRRFHFPAGATAPAGGAVTVHVGRGQANGTEFHWGLDEAIFENLKADGRGVGDGAYLFDPDGDLRAFQIYR